MERSQVTHLESGLHLQLECVDVDLIVAHDHKIIDVDPHDKAACTDAMEVDCMLGGAPLEPELDEGLVELGVPSVWGLAESI